MNKLFYVLNVMLCMNMFAAEDKVVVQNKILLGTNKKLKALSDFQWQQEMAEFDRMAAENDALFVKVNGTLASLTRVKAGCPAEPVVHVKPISHPGDDQSYLLSLESATTEVDKAIAGIDRALAITQKMSRRQSQ